MRPFPGSTCPDPGTPPGAVQIPYDNNNNDGLLYEIGRRVTYRCLQAGYYYNGPVLECVVSGMSVEWNGTYGYCEGEKDTLFNFCEL